jgi:8-oxo-dGTP pyrophosphatase MutT (NUDIX family)
MLLTLPSSLPGDEKSLDLIQSLLTGTPQPFSREQFHPGHITATGLVFHPHIPAVAMVLHARLQRWLLPGGHVEPNDPSILAAAAREVHEETGLLVEGGSIVGADVHPIPARCRDGQLIEPYHYHHDILVAFRANSAELSLSGESLDLRWVSPAEFDAFAVPPNIRRAYTRAAQ